MNDEAHAASFTAVGNESCVYFELLRCKPLTCDNATPVFRKVALRGIAHNAPSRLAGFRVYNGMQGKT